MPGQKARLPRVDCDDTKTRNVAGFNVRRPPIGAAAGRSLRKLSGRSLSSCLSPTTPRARVGMAERAGPLPPSRSPGSSLSLLSRFALSGALPFTMTFIELLRFPAFPWPPGSIIPPAVPTALR